MHLLVDASKSVGDQALVEARRVASELASPGRSVQVVSFGDGAQRWAQSSHPAAALTGIDPADQSDLAEGLRAVLAATELGGAGGEVVVVSDGAYTQADPRALVSELRAARLRVHHVPVGADPGADSGIVAVAVPASARLGQPVAVGVVVQAAVAGEGVLRLRRRGGGEAPWFEQTVAVGAGRTPFSLLLRPVVAGVLELEVELEWPDDPRPHNNLARAAVDVVGPERVVVVNQAGERTALVQALLAGGVPVEARDERWATTLGQLNGVAAVFLENVAVGYLGDGTERALEHFVRGGGGLVVTGGTRSFAAGGYFQSRLEPLLPVTLGNEERVERNRVAVAVVMDSSCSMGATVANGQTKMQLAGVGAAQAAGMLTARDEVALLTVDTTATERVPLQPLGTGAGREHILDQLRRVDSGGGGIYVEVALTAAIKVLMEDTTAVNRHILLFADAADAEQPGQSAKMLDQWRAAEGTLSTVGLGRATDADGPLLEGLGSIGGGRVFFTDDATRLPSIFAQDLMHVSRSGFARETRALIGAAGLQELQFEPAAWPSVEGYNRTQLATDATLMLVIPDEGDDLVPGMAGWRRGVGRVVAIPWEVAGEHTGDAMLGWPAYKELFRAVLEWVRRPSGPSDVGAEVMVDRGRAYFTVELDPARAHNDVPTAHVVLPDQSVAEVPLRWIGPHSLIGHHDLEAAGLHAPRVALAGRAALELPPVVLPYSPEYALDSARDGIGVLEHLSAATGGGRYLDEQSVATGAFTARGRDLTPLMLALLALGFLADIARRRGLLAPVEDRIAAAAAPVGRAVRSAGRRLARPARRALSEPPSEPDPPDPPEPPPASPFEEAKRRARFRLGDDD